MQNCREKSDVTTRFQGLVPRGVASDTSGTTPGSRIARYDGNTSYVNGRLVSLWHEGVAVAGAMCDCPIRNRRKPREQRAKAWRKWRGLPGLRQSGKKQAWFKGLGRILGANCAVNIYVSIPYEEARVQ